MHIIIAQRLHPFSHEPGVCCLIPKTTWQVQVFPTLLRFKNLAKASEDIWELPLQLKGPLKDFTVLLDMEKCRVEVFGAALEGYVRYYLQKEIEGIVLEFVKAPLNFGERKILPLACDFHLEKEVSERLSLGCHKSQDWTLVKRRSDLTEIFPFWLRLAQITPMIDRSIHEKKGLFSLLEACRQSIETSQKNEVGKQFTQFFRAAFDGILSPQGKDKHFLGLVENIEISCSPLILLHESAKLIRSLFIQEDEESLSLLPCLPTEFHSGRLTDLVLKNGDRLAIEWSKKLLKKVIWHPVEDRKCLLDIQKALKSFRVRSSLKERGFRNSRERPLELHAGKTLYLDRFEK